MEQKIFVTRTSMPPYEEFAEMIKPLWNTHWLTNMGKYHQAAGVFTGRTAVSDGKWPYVSGNGNPGNAVPGGK